MDRTGEHGQDGRTQGSRPACRPLSSVPRRGEPCVRLPCLRSPSLSLFALVVCVCSRLALVLQFRATGYTKPNTRKQAPF